MMLVYSSNDFVVLGFAPYCMRGVILISYENTKPFSLSLIFCPHVGYTPFPLYLHVETCATPTAAGSKWVVHNLKL